MGYYGAPIAANKVVCPAAGVPIKTFKPDAATASVVPTSPAVPTLAIASLPNNAYKPEAATPLSLASAVLLFASALVVIFLPTGGAPTLVLITAVSSTDYHIPLAVIGAL